MNNCNNEGSLLYITKKPMGRTFLSFKKYLMNTSALLCIMVKVENRIHVIQSL